MVVKEGWERSGIGNIADKRVLRGAAEHALDPLGLERSSKVIGQQSLWRTHIPTTIIIAIECALLRQVYIDYCLAQVAVLDSTCRSQLPQSLGKLSTNEASPERGIGSTLSCRGYCTTEDTICAHSSAKEERMGCSA